MNKRDFLKHSLLTGIGLPLISTNLAKAFEKVIDIAPGELATNVAFWEAIRNDYYLKVEYINLESGYYNIMPQSTLKSMLEYANMVNEEGAYYMRGVQAANKKRVNAKLADFLECSEKNIVITRNTTESLNAVIKGMEWKDGDEAVLATEDYGAMRNMFKQIAKRYGVKLKIVSVPVHPKNDGELVELYQKAITSKTKLLMVSHMINITGQILPVKKICEMARKKGVKTLVDGAHCVAHFNFKITEIGCDFYGASLHKWLAAPLGTGLLYVNDENIDSMWPLFAEDERDTGDITRLNHIGTHPVYHDLAIENAIEYCTAIGMQRKEERLRYLQEYWTVPARKIPGVILNTPEDSDRACAIANVAVEGMSPNELSAALMMRYKIFTVAINTETVKGVRITPNVFTNTIELDKLILALQELAA